MFINASNFKTVISIVFCIATLAGCAYKKPPVEKAYNLFPQTIGDEVLYADIEYNNGQYYLTDISNYVQDVRLNDMSPVGINLGEDMCTRGLLGITEGSCDNYYYEWEKRHMDSGNFLSHLLIWPLTTALLPFPPIMFVTGYCDGFDCLADYDRILLPISLTRAFDEERYKKVITQIQQESSISEIYPDLSRRYTSFYRELNDYQPPLLESTTTDYKTLANEEEEKFTALIREHLLTNMTLELNDQSNVFTGAIPPANFLIDVQVEALLEKPEFYEASAPKISFEDKDKFIADIFPSKSFEQFENSLDKAIASFTSIKKQHQMIAQHALSERQTNSHSNLKLFNEYRERLANARYQLKWIKKPGASFLLDRYDYQIRLPEQREFAFEQSKQAELSAHLVINTINQKRPWPRNLTVSSDPIAIVSTEETLSFENKTSSTINVTRTILSVGNQSTAVADQENTLFTLQPYETKTLYLSAFDISHFQSEITNNNIAVGIEVWFRNDNDHQEHSIKEYRAVPIHEFY